MKNTLLKISLAALGLAICASILITILFDGIKEEKQKIEAKIGKTIIMDKDTLIIVDYNSILETYKLNNGKEVSFKYAENNGK